MLENNRINFICGIADRDIHRATDYAYQTTYQADLGDILQSVASKALRQLGVTGAAVWAQELPEGPPKGVAMESVASAYAGIDPQAAAKWAETYAEKDWAQGALTIIRRRLSQMPAFGQ